jgi:ubiquinone/menaquinone biosynthesis C-methylase UbiE
LPRIGATSDDARRGQRVSRRLHTLWYNVQREVVATSMRNEAEVKERVAGIFGRSAPTYDTVIPFFATFGRLLVEAANLREGEHVLDLACGRGACLRPTAATVGPRGSVLGIDLSEPMIAATAAKLRAEGIENAEVRVGDAEHLDLPDAAFDVVLCAFGVFFFPDPSAAFAECHRVLRPGGRFAASTFLSGRGGFAWADEVARELGHDPQPVRSPVRQAEGLRSALDCAGFEEISSVERQARFLFADSDAYLAWVWSHAGRRVLEHLDERGLRRYHELAAQRLQAHAVDGGFELVQGVHLTHARRP